MHVLFMTFHLPKPSEAGAARPWEELQLMRELGYRVTVVTSAAHYLTGAIDKPVRRLWRRDCEDEVQVIRVWAPKGYRNSMKRRLLCYLAYSAIAPVASLAVRSVDVVFSATDPPFMTPGALVSSWLHRAKLVLDERDMYPETLLWLGINLPRPLLAGFTRWAHFLSHRANSTLTVSPGFVRLLQARGVSRDRIELLPNYFPSEAKPPRRDRKPKPGAMRVLYAGGLGQATELIWLLEAAEILQKTQRLDIQFVIAGEGEKRAEYEDFCRQRDLSTVRFLGAKPRREMDAVYEEADVAVHCLPTQWRNSLSSKIFEYLAHGLPVVFAGEGDIANVLEEARAGIVVPPGDPQAIAKELVQLADETELRESMAALGRAYTDRAFQRDIARQQLARALQAS